MIPTEIPVQIAYKRTVMMKESAKKRCVSSSDLHLDTRNQCRELLTRMLAISNNEVDRETDVQRSMRYTNAAMLSTRRMETMQAP